MDTRLDLDRRSTALWPFLFVSLFSGLAGASKSQAQLIVYESFAYDPRGYLAGPTGGTGWKGAWFRADGAKPPVVADAGLSFSKLSVDGGKCLLDGSDTRFFRYLDLARHDIAAHVETRADSRVLGRDGTTIWISFLIANKSYPKQSHGGVHLMDGVTLGANYKKTQRIQLGRQNMGNHWKLVRTDQGGPAAGTWDGTVTSDRTVRLLVYRFDFKFGPEEAWMWVDPTPGKEPIVAAADLHAAQVADFRFDAVNIGSGGNAKFDFDELRIGTSFEAVAPARAERD